MTRAHIAVFLSMVVIGCAEIEPIPPYEDVEDVEDVEDAEDDEDVDEDDNTDTAGGGSGGGGGSSQPDADDDDDRGNDPDAPEADPCDGSASRVATCRAPFIAEQTECLYGCMELDEVECDVGRCVHACNTAAHEGTKSCHAEHNPGCFPTPYVFSCFDFAYAEVDLCLESCVAGSPSGCFDPYDSAMIACYP